jgi:hypothetical protein
MMESGKLWGVGWNLNFYLVKLIRVFKHDFQLAVF